MARNYDYDDGPQQQAKRQDPDFEAVAASFEKICAKNEQTSWDVDELKIFWRKNHELQHEEDFREFLYFCARNNLDPGTNDVYAQVRWVKSAGRKVLAPVVMINVLRRRRAKEVDGFGKIEFEHDTQGRVVSATGWIARKSCKEPFWHTVYFDEYVAGGPAWQNKQHVMLGKCLEAALTRLAFSDVCAELYIAEEMAHEREAEATPTETEADDLTVTGKEEATAKPKPKDPLKTETKPKATPKKGASPELEKQKAEAAAEEKARKKAFVDTINAMAKAIDMNAKRFNENFIAFCTGSLEAKGVSANPKDIPIGAWEAMADGLAGWLQTDEGRKLFIDDPKKLGARAADEDPPQSKPANSDDQSSEKAEPTKDQEQKKPAPKGQPKHRKITGKYESWGEGGQAEAARFLALQEANDSTFDEEDFDSYVENLGLANLDEPNASAYFSIICANKTVGGMLMRLREPLQKDVAGIAEILAEALPNPIGESSPDDLAKAMETLANLAEEEGGGDGKAPLWEQ